MKETLKPTDYIPLLGLILLAACTPTPEVPRVPTPRQIGTEQAPEVVRTATPMITGELRPGETLQISISGLPKGD